MITIEDVTFDPRQTDKVQGLPLVFVIDEQCVYDFPATKYGSELFMKNNGIVDISSDYPDYDGITVKIIIDENNFEILQTSEYLGSILLTVDKAICLWDYPYGAYVYSPDAANFDGDKFIIHGRDMETLDPYPSGPPPSTSSEFFLL
jgi:hypothetical protein